MTQPERVEQLGLTTGLHPRSQLTERGRNISLGELTVLAHQVETDWIDNALSLNAARIVDSVDLEVLRGVLHPDYHFLPNALRPLLKVSGVQQLVDRLDPVAIKKVVTDEIARLAPKGYERHTYDMREGGALAARLLMEQEARNNSKEINQAAR